MKKTCLVFLLLWVPKLSAMQKEDLVKQSKPEVVFLVMETSDQDPIESAILDIAALVVDPDITYVKNEIYSVISNSHTNVDYIHPYKKPRIIQSGLHEKVQSPKASSLQDVSDRIVQALEPQPTDQSLAILAGDGNIVLYQQFLNTKMPEVAKRLSLKEPINVASIRTAIRQLHPDDSFTLKRSNNSLDRAHALFEAFKYYKYRYLTNVADKK